MRAGVRSCGTNLAQPVLAPFRKNATCIEASGAQHERLDYTSAALKVLPA